MDLPDGVYTVKPGSGRLLVKTARTGLGSKAGHDLTIEVTRWHATASVDTANAANSSVTVSVEVDSFEVREGAGGVKPLTDSDRADIKKTLREKILHTASHPTISFTSSHVEGSADAFTITGNLTITGVTRPAAIQCRATGGRVTGTAIITQTDWGIRPYSAFFGALKLRDDVEVVFDAAITPEA